MRLGRTEIEVAPVGVGTWAWGDRGDWGYGRDFDAGDVEAAFRAATGAPGPPVLFDTAERYGSGESERLLGRLVRGAGRPVVVATKFSPGRWDIRRASLLRALRGSLGRLGLERVDLYQVHWPTRFSSVAGRMGAMADAVADGLVRAVGVSNFSSEQVLRAHDVLARRGIPLATVQVEYSLLHRAPESNGVGAACAERGITLLAYSPLGMGLLAGKYGPGRPPPGGRSASWPPDRLARLERLLGLLREVGVRHDGRTPAQVALAWVRARGALPIPGAKSGRQAAENLGGAGWDLAPDEVEELRAAADAVGPSPSR